MNSLNEIINKEIYDICVLIQNITKLDVEFMDNNRSNSFQLFNLKMHFLPTSLKRRVFMDKILRTNEVKDFLFHTDDFQLSYLGVGIWSSKVYKGTIIVGPFLSDIPSDSFISRVIELNKLPLGQRQQLQQFYISLPVLDLGSYRSIGSLMVNFAVNPFIDANVLFSKDEDNAHVSSDYKYKNEIESEKFYSEVELRYKIEKEIQNAVEKGSREKLLKAMNKFRYNPTYRIPTNPLRAQKNLAYSFHTLLRNAAERGGVSPINIHSICDKYAVLIEKTSNMNELDNLVKKMSFEYCDLVKNFSTAGYSPMIRRVIDYIYFNFHYKLSLKKIAHIINVTPSYISRQFKKETGLTIIEFINKKRIEEAKFLINQNNNSITEIALMVGFETHNYFCSVFKQITSLTPMEYKNHLK